MNDHFKAKILAELDNPEHVRSERVSKWFQRVGLGLSWHDVTMLIDHVDPWSEKNSRKDFGPFEAYSKEMVC